MFNQCCGFGHKMKFARLCRRTTSKTYGMMRIVPVLLNLANQGQSWRENGISHERVVRRIKAPIEAGCPALWIYLEARLEQARHLGWFGA